MLLNDGINILSRSRRKINILTYKNEILVIKIYETHTDDEVTRFNNTNASIVYTVVQLVMDKLLTFVFLIIV